MSLYLKYRPKTFADVVGEKHITDILLAQAKTGNFSHNYLLYGPRGTGKTTTARLLAKVVNCTTFKDDGTPDLENDPASKLIDEGKTLDFIEIDAASHTGVDNIREEIIDKALYQPTHLQKKVYVIDEVHMLSKGAFNALLKIMEEPPKYLFFVLATTEINKVPDTISSRCQVFNFKRHSIDDIVGNLKYIAGEENIAYEEEGLRLIAKLASGAMRDAIKYLEQVSLLGKITAEHVSQFLGVVSDSVLQAFLDILQGGTFEQLSTYLDTLVENGTDMTHFTKDLLLRLDEHFMENPALYGKLATILKEIYSNIKNYPYPILIYKSKFYLYFNEGDQQHKEQKTPPKKENHDTPNVSTKEKSASTTSSTTQISDNTISKGEDTNTPASRSHEEKSSSTDISPKEKVSTGKQEAPKTPDSISRDAEELKTKMLEKIDKKMLKSSIKNYAMIRTIDKKSIDIVIINQTYFNTVQKTENSKYFQDIIQDITGHPFHINRIYMNKEEYLQSLTK